MNYSHLLNNSAECVGGGGLIDTTCVYNHICGNITGHFRFWGIALLIAYVLVDMVIPLIFAYVLPKIKPQEAYKQLWAEEWQGKALKWLKERLIFAFAILTFYQIFL